MLSDCDDPGDAISPGAQPSRWLTVVDDERGHMKIEFNGGMAFLHLALKQVMQGMRDTKRLFPDLKAWLRSMGHEFVFVIIPTGDEKLYRFEQMFGFKEVRRTSGHILMAQRC